VLSGMRYVQAGTMRTVAKTNNVYEVS
jgi:hypothetical protein